MKLVSRISITILLFHCSLIFGQSTPDDSLSTLVVNIGNLVVSGLDFAATVSSINDPEQSTTAEEAVLDTAYSNLGAHLLKVFYDAGKGNPQQCDITSVKSLTFTTTMMTTSLKISTFLLSPTAENFLSAHTAWKALGSELLVLLKALNDPVFYCTKNIEGNWCDSKVKAASDAMKQLVAIQEEISDLINKLVVKEANQEEKIVPWAEAKAT